MFKIIYIFIEEEEREEQCLKYLGAKGKILKIIGKIPLLFLSKLLFYKML